MEERKQDYGLVSIIMPTYNAGKYLRASIDSVLAQSYENFELLITDDCSADDTAEIVKSYDDKRIFFERNKENCGAAGSRNNSIARAKGKWIAFLDSDDLWEKDKLSRHLSFMIEQDADFSITAYRVSNAKAQTEKEYDPPKDSYGYKDILKHSTIGCSTVIYNADRLGKVYMPEAEKREDLACWLEILRPGRRAICLHEQLTVYRIHGGSVSAKKRKMIKYQWWVYRKNEKIKLIPALYYLANWAVRGVFKYRQKRR